MRWLHDVVERVRLFVFRNREEREVEEELAFHVEMETDARRRRGATPDEARRQSLVALGGIESTREAVREARGTTLLEHTIGDAVRAVRTLAASPGFALTTVLTLAVGIGSTTAIYGAVERVLLRPLPYRDPGRLVRVYQNTVDEPDGRFYVTPVHFVEFRRRLSSFEALAAMRTYSPTGADVGRGDAAERLRVLPVSADYFSVMATRPAIGRPFERNEEDGRPVVILSHDTWVRRLGGSPAVVGRPFVMSDRPYTIAGVMPAGYADPVAGRVDAWIPLDLRPGADPGNADNHYVTILGRLAPGVTLAQAQAELTTVAEQIGRIYPAASNERARVYPLKADLVGRSSRSLWLMLGAVVLVFVLVCVNIANLMLVRGSARRREFALRSALGGGRARLLRQVVVESLMLALVGDLAGVLVAYAVTAGIASLGGHALPRLASVSFEPRHLGVSLVLATLSAVAFGAAPAVQAARAEPADVLREHGRGATAARASLRVREWLVVGQVALAFVLLSTSGLLAVSAAKLDAVDLGVNEQQAFVFELHLPDARYGPAARARFYESFARQVEGLPAVVAAGGVSKLPATGPFHQWGTRARSGPLANTGRGQLSAVQQRVVSGDYFAAAGIRMLAGRTFDERDDASAPHRFLVSRSLAERFFPGLDPIGQRLQVAGVDGEVIGVVGDVALTPEGEAGLYVYHAHRQMAANRNWSLVQVVRTRGSLAAVQADVRRLVAALDPQLVMYEPATLVDVIGHGEAQRTFTLRVVGMFAVVALALAGLGLFGVLAYGVRLRATEFGVRMALGAGRAPILRLVLGRGLTLGAIGIGFGLVGAAAVSRAMTALVFQVRPLDPIVLGGASVFMLLVVAAAAYLPARHATAFEPRALLQ